MSSLVPAALLLKRAAAAKKKTAAKALAEKSTISSGNPENTNVPVKTAQLTAKALETAGKDGNDGGNDSDEDTVVSEASHVSDSDDVYHIPSTPTHLCEVHGAGASLEHRHSAEKGKEVASAEAGEAKATGQEKSMFDLNQMLKSALSINSSNNDNNGDSNAHNGNNGNDNSAYNGDSTATSDSKSLLGSLISRKKGRKSSMKTVVLPGTHPDINLLFRAIGLLL